MKKTKYASPFKLSSSPHVKSEESDPTIMYWVVGSLGPAMGGAIYFFGFDAIRILLISIFL